jgi:uncharacterized Tic20 family protein
MTTQPPAQPAANPEQGYTTLTLNYWLSVFFSWIPALIFYFVEKGKNSVIDEHNRVNLNFQLVRTIVGVAAAIIPTVLGWIPFIGWFLALIVGLALWVASIVLFVFAIIAAVKAPEEARAGRIYKFPFNLELVK